MPYAIPNAKLMFDGSISADELAERGSINKNVKSNMQVAEERVAFVEAMTKATVAGAVGETLFGNALDPQFEIPAIIHNAARRDEVMKAYGEVEMAKSMGAEAPVGMFGARSSILAKEWTLTNPVGTGLIPYDLEAPAKLLTPRPTPLRNSIPRIKGQGGARRFKVISGFTGTGTGGATTVQPGVTESSTNAGPGGLSYVRGPYINYAGYDVTLNYVTTSLSDSVSWQA